MTPAAIIEQEPTVKTLRIAADLSLPLDAVTQTLAAIGRKGAGKTYLATMLAEQMLDAAAQVVVLDPVGNWWGLRVGADGRSKGKEVFVLGGDHGDVPLTPEAGARVARLIVEKRISVVLDISPFRQGERKRFAADFGEELFHLKKAQRTPVHLFVEEAQLFAPQRAGPDEARMLGAYENIIRLGRNYGVGATLVTQRPQSVNKEVLSQVECLCVLQVNGTHERKALEEWVQEAGADRKLVGELPGLGRGEGYVWSPSWLRIFKRVRFAKKATFDASATPEVGRETRAASLSAVDVDALRADLAEVVKKAEADDPRALRRQIAELQRELAKKPAAAPPAAPMIQRVEVPVLKDGQLQRIEKAADAAAVALNKVMTHILGLLQQLEAAAPAPRAGRVDVLLGRKPPAVATLTAPRRVAPARPPAEGEPQLRAGERRILEVLARSRPARRSRAQLGTLSGFTPSGGTFQTYWGVLKRFGLVEEHRDGLASITDAGLAQIGEVADGAPQTRAEVIETWRRALRAGERAMLDALLAAPEGLTREELGQRTGFTASGGTFQTYLGVLRRNGLAEVDGDLVRPGEAILSVE